MAATADPRQPLFDSFAPGLAENPYPHYERLRCAEPVHWDPVLRAWVLTGMAEVRAVLADESFAVLDLGKSIAEIGRWTRKDLSHLVRTVDAMTFFRNGDEHRASRRALAQAIARVPFRELEPAVDAIAAELTADLSRRSEFDAAADYAAVLPARVMAHILGLPPEDAAFLNECGDEVAQAFDIVSAGVYERLNRKAEAALNHLAARVEEALGRGEQNGITTLYAHAPHDGDDKIMAAAALIFFAFAVGSVTSVALIGLAIDLLLSRPDLYRQARGDVSLAGAIAAEAGRLESPVQRSLRIATQDRTIGGRMITCGQKVILLLGAANRDPAAFDEPDSLQLGRNDGRDVVFGGGRHICVGMQLGQLEARVALKHLLGMPPLARADSPKAWHAAATIRRLASLPVRLTDNGGSR